MPKGNASAAVFIKNGMALYLDALIAVKEFERQVDDVAMTVMKRHVAGLSKRLGLKPVHREVKSGQGRESDSSWRWAGVDNISKGEQISWLGIGVTWEKEGKETKVSAWATVYMNSKNLADELCKSLKDLGADPMLENDDGDCVTFSFDIPRNAAKSLDTYLEKVVQKWIKWGPKVRPILKSGR